MVRDPKDLISIEAPKTDFEKFLTEDNKRVFFSGPFGIGKTYFLKEFFNTWHKDEYDVYHLFPVNYQISSNENIVEFLKYDILVELLKKHRGAFKGREIKGLRGIFKFLTAFSKGRGLKSRSLKSVIDIGTNALSLSPDPFSQAISKLGRPLGDLIDLSTEFAEFRQEYTSGDQGIVKSFLNETENKTPKVATDHISHLLYEKIEMLKGENKRSVLILDDFDRIDPEHTFRILNVLSAHIESDKQNESGPKHIEDNVHNKFGFDHIIIVGDINNLRNIFHHEYGEKTDFVGYFDKFFTVKPFEFTNEKAIAERIPYLMERIQYENTNLGDTMPSIQALLQDFLTQALSVKAMNLRQLYKPIDYLFPEMSDRKNSPNPKNTMVYHAALAVDIGIKLLIAIYGTETDFLNALKTIRDNPSLDILPPKEEHRRLLYLKIPSPMLELMLRPKPLKDGQRCDYTWLEYDVSSIKQPNRLDIDVHPKQSSDVNARYFYKTLYEYVEQSKFKARSPDDYDLLGKKPLD